RTVEIHVLALSVRRVALRPPGIGQVLLRRVRDGARPQEEGEPARPDAGRFQRTERVAARVSGMAHPPRKRPNPHDPTTAAFNVRRSWPRRSSTSGRCATGSLIRTYV